MLTISKPLSASQARRYHEEEFQNARENYYTEGDLIRGVWYGELAHRWSLAGEVREEHFGRLAEGQHPMTGEQLVRHQTAREAKNARGETVTTMQHRAGWDATFSAPKSVSSTSTRPAPVVKQIEDYLAEADRQGAAAAQIAAHQTREAKLDVSHEEMQRRHQELAERFGNQPTKVVETTEHRHEHHVEHEREQADAARRAVTFARDRNLEREAVVEERAILRDALQ